MSLSPLAVHAADPAGADATAPEATPARPRQALSLSQAQERALRYQPSLRQARGQTDAAAGRTEQARAGYLPQAALTGSYQRTTGNFALRPGSTPNMSSSRATTTSGWSSTTYNFLSFGLNASQLIYDFGQTDGRWLAAAASRDAARAGELTAEQQALLAVRRAYFLVRADGDLIGVARDTLANQERHLNQIQAFVRAGIRPEIDLAQARTAVANARVQLVTATNDDAVARAQLNQTMGNFENVDYDLADAGLAPVAGEQGPLDAMVGSALATRPELETIRRQRRAQELTVAALRGAFGPALGAAAGATEAGQDFGHLVPNWFLGLTLNWPFLQGGLTRGQIHEGEGVLATLAAQEDSLRLTVRVDVEQGQLAVRGAKATIAAAQEALASARDQLRLAEARYANGLGSVIELGDAQVAFSAAAAQDVQARFNLSSARAQLMAALGVR
ncbi:MAG TPA: TolC family protein [Polyangia bacterium]|jgi:outer membrane protein|nr:TolC family protein [Polyangia bacterium]